MTRPGLGLKLVVFGVGLTALAIGTSFVVLAARIRATTKDFFTRELRHSQSALVALHRQSLGQLLTTSALMTEHPTLRAAMETYRAERGGAVRPELVTTVQREGAKILAGLGRDLLIVTDEAGRVLTSIERQGAVPAAMVDLSRLPPVARALDPEVPADAPAAGVVRFQDVDFHIGVVPILLQDLPIGVLVVGDRLDAAYARRLQDQLSADIVVADAAGAILVSTLPDSVARAVGNVTPDDATIEAGGVTFARAATPLGEDTAAGVVTLHLLHSISDAMAPLNRSLRAGFFLYGLLAVVVAGIGAALVARTVLQPLAQFVGFVRDVAATGNYRSRFEAPGAPREIASLNDSYDQLVTSLARQHVELEEINVALRAQIAERERAEAALSQSEEQLRQSQKLEAIGRLAGGVAHDFNNLLTVILSYTQLIRSSVEDDDPIRADLTQVEEAARRAGTLTHQLLAFSRKQVLQPRVIDLSAVVDGVQPMLSRLVGEDITLRAIAHDRVSRVKADPGQIEQVLLNLVANARDAMPRGGTLTITTQDVETMDPQVSQPLDGMRPGPWVLLSVQDTGMGMDEATKNRIFEPFFTTKEPGKGTGLGLAMVYGIVKQSGGFIWVDTAPNQGTTFRIYLPPVADMAVAPAKTGPPSPPPRGTETVLVVEDATPVRELAERCLRRLGYRVLAASNGVEALEVAERHDGPIDLLLTDVVMPRLSGADLVERLRATRPDTRVLYMSGYPQDTIGERGMLAPETALLQKPFVPEELARRVRSVLDTVRGNRG